MPRFNKNNIKELKEFLYNSYYHDAKMKGIKYNCEEDSLRIESYNPIFNTKIDLAFYNIGGVFAVKGDWGGDRETVLALTLEEDFSFLQNYLLKQSEYKEDSLYLVLQMFSGDELHIVSKEMSIVVRNY